LGHPASSSRRCWWPPTPALLPARAPVRSGSASGPNLPNVLLPVPRDRHQRAAAGDPRGHLRPAAPGSSSSRRGPSLYVEADLGFGEQQVGTTTKRPPRAAQRRGGDSDCLGYRRGVRRYLDRGPAPPAPGSPVVLGTGDRRGIRRALRADRNRRTGARFLTVSSDDPDQPVVEESRPTGFGVAHRAPPASAPGPFVEFGNRAVRLARPRSASRSATPATATLTVRHTVQLDPAGSNRFRAARPPRAAAGDRARRRDGRPGAVQTRSPTGRLRGPRSSFPGYRQRRGPGGQPVRAGDHDGPAGMVATLLNGPSV